VKQLDIKWGGHALTIRVDASFGATYDRPGVALFGFTAGPITGAVGITAAQLRTLAHMATCAADELDAKLLPVADATESDFGAFEEVAQ
jgi:hypothetical protein